MKLTIEEIHKFMARVRGKKIRWYSWNNKDTFTPDGSYSNDGSFTGVNSRGNAYSYFMVEGLAEGSWSLVDGEEDKCAEEKLASKPKTIRCECGKEKHNFATHSDWCPKFEKWS
jgi:hypothetical protein